MLEYIEQYILGVALVKRYICMFLFCDILYLLLCIWCNILCWVACWYIFAHCINGVVVVKRNISMFLLRYFGLTCMYLWRHYTLTEMLIHCTHMHEVTVVRRYIYIYCNMLTEMLWIYCAIYAWKGCGNIYVLVVRQFVLIWYYENWHMHKIHIYIGGLGHGPWTKHWRRGCSIARWEFCFCQQW